jgi:hypothetical protein
MEYTPGATSGIETVVAKLPWPSATDPPIFWPVTLFHRISIGAPGVTASPRTLTVDWPGAEEGLVATIRAWAVHAQLAPTIPKPSAVRATAATLARRPIRMIPPVPGLQPSRERQGQYGNGF